MRISRRIVVVGLMLATFMPVFVGTPAYAGKGFSESCTVSVLYAPASGTFYVSTRANATGGYLPSPQTDFLSSYKNAALYNSQSQTSSILNKSTNFTFTIAVLSNGAGAYSFYSQVGQLKGSRFTQLASCSGNFNL